MALNEEDCKCAVCTETWVHPHTLSCQHTFCRSCVKDMIFFNKIDSIKEGNISSSISCPMCKAKIKIPKGDIVSNIPLETIFGKL